LPGCPQPPKQAAPAPSHAPAPADDEGPGIERADGKALSILSEGRRCIHARFCVTGLPGVFRASKPFCDGTHQAFGFVAD
jgi:hypothetical protein